MKIEQLSTNELRKFGFTLTSVFIGAFGLLLPLLFQKAMPAWPFIIGTALLIPTMIKPAMLKFIYTPWMKVGHVLGWINTRIILGVIFFVLITPTGFIRRLLGKDTLGLEFDKKAITYRKYVNAQSIQHMEKPF
jgi:hypothetical protein